VLTATVATIGRKTAVVAVLEVISVRKRISAVTAATRTMVGKSSSPARPPPTV
jgi:hypothetical protein